MACAIHWKVLGGCGVVDVATPVARPTMRNRKSLMSAALLPASPDTACACVKTYEGFRFRSSGKPEPVGEHPGRFAARGPQARAPCNRSRQKNWRIHTRMLDRRAAVGFLPARPLLPVAGRAVQLVAAATHGTESQ